MVLPLDNPRLREEVSSRDNYFIGEKEPLPYNVEYALARIMNKELEMQSTVEAQKKDLLNRYDYNVQAAFKVIDVRHTRYIDFENLSCFLKKRAGTVQADDVAAFMRRADRDLDCKVSYGEFIAAMQPVDPKTKTKPSYITPTKAFQAGSRPGSAAKFSSVKKAAKSKTGGKMNANRSFNAGTRQTPVRSSTHTTLSQERRWPATEKKRGDSLLRSEKKHSSALKSPGIERTRSPSSSAKKRVPPKSAKKEPRAFTVYNLMEEQLNDEKKIELMRQDLAVHSDVTVHKVCAQFDPEVKGYVGAVDFLEALRELGLSPDRESVYQVFNRFDRDLDGRLEYADLVDMVMPIEEEYAAVLQERVSRERAKLSTESVTVLKRLMQTYLDTAKENEAFKARVKNLDARKSFEECDIGDVGYFTAENVIRLRYNKRE